MNNDSFDKFACAVFAQCEVFYKTPIHYCFEQSRVLALWLTTQDPSFCDLSPVTQSTVTSEVEKGIVHVETFAIGNVSTRVTARTFKRALYGNLVRQSTTLRTLTGVLSFATPYIGDDECFVELTVNDDSATLFSTRDESATMLTLLTYLQTNLS